MCLEPWTTHNESTGGYYKCNKYNESLKNPEIEKKLKKKEKVKNELQKYMWHYEHWDNHWRAEKKAEELQSTVFQCRDSLIKNEKISISESEFLKIGIAEVIRCREVLRWTYAYGYYIENKKEKELFLCIQELLEKKLREVT